ncbi:Uncharacterised protein (plasmid) [Klebsiella aerogenes]|nr:Uncharacterised protein [Klebsiella aerogenes]
MKNKLIISLLLASVLTPSVSHAFGNRDSWVSGYVQGTSEYTILGKGQSQLYLACDSSGSQPATIIFTDVNGHQVRMDSGQTLTMRIDNAERSEYQRKRVSCGIRQCDVGMEQITHRQTCFGFR